MTLLDDDKEVRRRIGPWQEEGVADLSDFEPDTNFFVRAAAGSGKTTSLVARMVGLVRTGVPAADIAAITFTRKAAGEMSKRFFEELRRTESALPEGSEERARVRNALQNAHQTYIGTVHAFCARLLRERPLAADLPPDFTAGLEDREKRQLRERAWQRYLQQVREEHPERIEEIADLGIEPDELHGYFERLCEHPELDPYVRPPDETPDLGAAVDTTVRRFRDWQNKRPDKCPNGRDGAMKAFDKAEKMLAYEAVDSPARQEAFLDLFAELGSRDVTLKCWRGEEKSSYDWARTLRDELLSDLVENVIEPACRPWKAYVHSKVVEFVRPAVQVFGQLRRDEGALTFHDLLVQTRNLLRENPTVREAIRRRYPRLLVDEFQDTDPLQAEILFYLTSQNATTTEWTECEPIPGSLFIVGDDKQSIYRFRRADMETFELVGRLLEEAGGEAVTLTRNFRSRPGICDWCNEAFATIFQEPELADLQAEYTPFVPHRPPGTTGPRLRRIEIGDIPYNSGDDIAQIDAERIARFIRAAHEGASGGPAADGTGAALSEGGADYSDFLILTRRKQRLSIYAEALAELGIPYTVTGSEDLGDSEELKTIVDLLTCALRPDDEVACIAYLKGMLVGASDDDLYRYRRAGGSFDRMHEPPPEEVLQDLDDDTSTLFARAFDRIRGARALLRNERPSVALEQIVSESGLLAGAVHPGDPSEGSLRGGRVLRTITYVQHLSAQGMSWAEVLEELQRVIDGEEDVDSMTLETGSREAVRVMNVHQAKGLEAPVVFLADPYSSGGGHSVQQHLRRDTGEIVAPVVQGGGQYQYVTHPPLGWEEPVDGEGEGFRDLEERHEAAEERRLLYVAATRAEEMLVVSRYRADNWDEDRGYWAPLYPFLDQTNVPELDVPAPLDSPHLDDVPAPDVRNRQEARMDRLRKLAQPSYQVRSVTTEETLKATHALHTEEEGYGNAFGEAIHRVLQIRVQTRSDDLITDEAILRACLERAGAEASPQQVRRAREMMDQFLESRVWHDLQTADSVYTEYPISEVSAGDSVPVVERGVIDLAYRTNGTWMLVDYKSDRVQTSLSSRLSDDHPYVQQIRAYVDAWGDLFGAADLRGGLWFADVGTFVTVVGGPDENGDLQAAAE